jgi:hypothetical protein
MVILGKRVRRRVIDSTWVNELRLEHDVPDGASEWASTKWGGVDRLGLRVVLPKGYWSGRTDLDVDRVLCEV